jgi:hypothetical protein
MEQKTSLRYSYMYFPSMQSNIRSLPRTTKKQTKQAYKKLTYKVLCKTDETKLNITFSSQYVGANSIW